MRMSRCTVSLVVSLHILAFHGSSDRLHAAQLQLAGVDLKIKLAPAISSLVLTPTSVLGGAVVSGTITLRDPASSGGVTVKLRSSNPAVAAVPETVVVQEGRNSATIVVQTYPLAINPSGIVNPAVAAISAQIGASVPNTAPLTVQPATLATFTLDPTSLAGGRHATGQVTITGAAPTGGLPLVLSDLSDRTRTRSTSPFGNEGPLTMPARVTVPAGATTASFTIRTRPVSTETGFQISAAQGVSITRTATLTLMPPGPSSISIDPRFLIGGGNVSAKVNLTGAAPAEGMTVPVEIKIGSGGTSNPGPNCGPHPTAPAKVQVSSGTTAGPFTIQTYPGRGAWFIVFAGTGSGDYFLTYPPALAGDALVMPSSVKGGTSIQAKLRLAGQAAPAECGIHYKLESSNSLYAQVPNSVTVTPGQTETTFTVTTSGVPTSQNIIIRVFGNLGNLGSGAATNFSDGWRQATLTLTP